MRPSMRAPSVTPMASAKTPTNGLKIDVAALRMSFILGALNWGVRHLLLLTTYHTMANRPGAGRTESNRRGAATNRTCKPLRPACHENNAMSRAATYVTIASAAG